jgi:hypothetical protein
VIRVLLEQFANAEAVLNELLLKRDELLGNGDGESAFGGGDRRGASPGTSVCKPSSSVQAIASAPAGQASSSGP